MALDDEEALELLGALRSAVNKLTERLGSSTSDLPAFRGRLSIGGRSRGTVHRIRHTR
jgi:hypothetical protein